MDEGHFAQLRIHEDWCKQERERSWWQEWEDSWAWDWAEDRSTWADWSAGGCRIHEDRSSQEPTALSHEHPASSSWEEDKDPATLTVDCVHEGMGTHRSLALTPPLSFQPQRHITMILGRPVMVHMWSKNLRAIL